MSEREEEFWLWRQGEAVEWVSPSSRGKLPSAPPTAFDLDDLPRLRVGYEQPEIGTELGRSTGLADAVCLALSSQRTVRLRLAQDLVDDSGSSWDWTRVPFEWMRHRDAPLHGRVVVERFVPVTAVDPPEAAVPRLDIQVFKRLETNEDLEFTKALSPDGQLPIDDLVVLDEPHCAAAFANPKLDLSRLSALVLVCHGTKADSLRPFRLPDRSSWALPHSHGLPPLVVLLVCGSDAGNLLRYARDALLLSGETQTVIASAGELGLSAAGEFLRQFLRDWSAGRAVHEIVRDAQAALAGKPDGFDARRLCILGRGDLRLETPAGSDWMHPLQELPDSHLAIRIRNRTDKEASALAALANRAALTCLLKRGPSFEEELRRRLGIGARAALAPYLETCLKGAGPGTTGVVQLWNLSWYWLKVLQGQQTQMVDREDFAPYRQDIMPFPAQGETGRASPGFRVDDLPTPLALAWKEVNAALDRQQLVQARPLLQRAFNVTVCFIASVAAMDLLRANTEDRGSPGERADLVEHLFRSPKRLDAEGWVECLRLALRNKGAKRQIDGLRAIAFDGNAKTELMHLLARDYLAWQIEGDEDPGKRTEKLVSPLLFWLERLRRLIETAAESWKGWTFRDGRHSVRWHGTSPEATDAMPALRSNDVSVPLVLEHRDGRKLDLSPLITVLRCSHCRSRKVFLFARRSGTVGAQYFHLSGEHVAKEHVTPLSNVPELGKLFPRRTLEGTHAKSAHTGRIEDEQDALADFDKGEPPQYLFDLLRSACDKLEAGYVGLAAPEGYGKTWFARMYAAECREVPGERVLLYSVGDWRSDVGQFLESLCELASEQLLKGVETAHEQALRQDSASGQFVALVGKLVEVNRLDRLTIIIDGSNELPPASDIDGTTKGERPKASSVIGYLPRATPLPAGVFVVLTGRDEWNFGREGNELKRALKDAGRWVDLHLTPKLAKNIELVRTYVALHVPKQSDVDLVMKLGGGVFLWCRHFVKAIGPGALAEGQDLPEVRTFYPAYLKSLSESDRQVLMRLAAAREPVTQSQLKLWGLSKSQLHDALKKLRDFLSVSDVRTHFSIKHMGLLSYLESDEAMSRHLNATHADIVTRTFDWAQGRWAQLDLTNEDDRYAVKFFPWHIVSAGGQRVLGLAIDECFEGTLRLIERTQATGGLERNDISMALAEAAAGWAIAFAQDRRPRATVGAYIEAIELLSVARIDEAMAYLPKAHLNGGKELEALDDFDQALLSYEKCIESLGDLERVESDGMRDGPYNWSDHSRRVFLSDLPRSREKLAAYDKVIALRGELVAKGRKDVRKALAGSHWGRGLALNKLGRHEEEVVACDAAIALWGELLAEGDKEVREEIARTHRNRAIALVNLGRQEEAVAAYDATIALLAESRKAVREELAYSHHNRATALTKLDRLEEAAAAYGEAIALRGELLAEGRKEVRMDLANSHLYLGLAMTNLGRQEEAAAAYGGAIALRRDLLAEGRKEVRMDLATAHHNRGDALFSLGDHEEAAVAYGEAIALRDKLLAEGRREVRIDLANSHHYRGDALIRVGRHEEAVAAHGEAIALRGELLTEGCKEVRKSLAGSHWSRGLALSKLGRHEEEVVAYDAAIALWGELLTEGDKDVRGDIAGAHSNRAIELVRLGRREEAVAAYEVAIALWGELLAEGRKEVRERLAKLHYDLGDQVLKLDRHKVAAAAFGNAIALWSELLAEGRSEVRVDLSAAHHRRGDILEALGHHQRALMAFDEAIALRSYLLADGNEEVRAALGETHRARGVTLEKLHRHEEAVAAFSEAKALSSGAGRPSQFEPLPPDRRVRKSHTRPKSQPFGD